MNSKIRRYKLLVIVGAPYSGKTSLKNNLMILRPGEFVFSCSATTRAPRGNEKDGIDYFFIQTFIFLRMISRKKFAEWNKFDTGKFYGTPISEIEKANNLGKVVLLDIEINGAKQIFETYGSEAYYVFLKVNEKVANDRSEERGTETPEEKAIRIENLRKQQTLLDELLENGKNFFDSIVDTNELEEGFIANIVINDFISRNTLC